MTLDRRDPLDVLYLECLPRRLAEPPSCTDGPTRQWELYLERLDLDLLPLTVVGDAA